MITHERLFTTGEFERLASTVLAPNERVELLDGRIVTMSPIGSRHVCCVNELAEWLFVHIVKHAFISIQNSVELSEYSEPQPDIVVLKRRPDNYRDHLPTVDDILLLIEVADSSEQSDREIKVPLYAREGVKEVWIVSLNTRFVDVFREPRDGAYQTTVRYLPGQSIPIQLDETFHIPADAFLGPAE